MILSILIPTIPSRQQMFTSLYTELIKQCDAVKEFASVEILFDADKEFLLGGKSIGGKRNYLVQQATGKYLCFLDDDDVVAPNYVETIVRMMHSDMESYSFNSLFKNDYYFTLIEMSFDNKENEQASPNGIIKRTLWHICPILTSIAKSEEFTNINSSEDWDWMQRIIPKIKTSEHIDMILHQYNHFNNVSESDKILQHGHK